MARLVPEWATADPVDPFGHGDPAHAVPDHIVGKPAEPYLRRPDRRIVVESPDTGRREPDGTCNRPGSPQAQFVGLQSPQVCGYRCSFQDCVLEGQLPGDPRAVQGDLATGHETGVAFHVAIDDEAGGGDSLASTVTNRGAAQADRADDVCPVQADPFLDHRPVEIEDALGPHPGSVEARQVAVRDPDSPGSGLHEPRRFIESAARQNQGVADPRPPSNPGGR